MWHPGACARPPSPRPPCPLDATWHVGSLWGRLSWREQLQGSGEPVRACAFPSLRRAHPLVAGVQNAGGRAEGRRRGVGVGWGGVALVGLPRPWRGAAGLCGSGGSEHCQLEAGRADGHCGWRQVHGHVTGCDTPASGLEGHQLSLLASPGLEPGPLSPSPLGSRSHRTSSFLPWLSP